MTRECPAGLPGRGMFGIRVILPHSVHCPVKQAFSASILARCSACKINGFCVRLCRTLFGHLISEARNVVVICTIEFYCNILFLIRLRLVTTFYTYPEHTPSLRAPPLSASTSHPVICQKLPARGLRWLACPTTMVYTLYRACGTSMPGVQRSAMEGPSYAPVDTTFRTRHARGTPRR